MEPTNFRLPGVRRLLREAKELSEPNGQYYACPLDENIFEWHFTIRGPSQTPYENGIYHGRILFPTEYPMKPPAIIFLTPNGRFQTDKKICLSVSNYHPEQWRPSWGAIIGFFPSPTEGAIGSTDIPDTEKMKLANASINWTCKLCQQKNKDILAPVDAHHASIIADQINDIRDQIVISPEVLLSLRKSLPDDDEEQNKSSSQDMEYVPKVKPSYALPFPWIPCVEFGLDKIQLTCISPNIDSKNHVIQNIQSKMKMPLYDWELESIRERASNRGQTEDQSQYIPRTKIKMECAFDPLFHLKQVLILMIFLVLIYMFGQKIVVLLSSLFF